MTETISVVISVPAFAVSVATAWLTMFRRGTVRMTAPTVIFFGPDGGPSEDRKLSAKVFLRTLLYSTSKRGRIVESMYVRLRRGESAQTFNIWVYGDTTLARGSGIFVSENGVVCNHHFLLPSDGTNFEFMAGEYVLEVFASLVGNGSTLRLFSTRLVIAVENAARLKNPENGLYFDWGPDSQCYHAHVDSRPKRGPSPFLVGLPNPPMTPAQIEADGVDHT